MNGRVLIGLCTTIEVVCISAIAAIGLKRTNDAYKAELKANHAECELFKSKVDCIFKDAEIKLLKKELAELKEKYESEDVESE